MLLRELFTARGIEAAIRAGTVTLVDLPEKRHPAPASLREAPGTVSEFWWIYDEGLRIALIHQYHRPDCTLAASGHPDPKWLADGEEVLIPAHPDNIRCDDCRPRQSYV